MEHTSRDLPGILKRLEVLEAERDILRTMYRYAHCIDYGLEKEWVDLFVEDAVYQRATQRHQGRAELSAFIAAHTRPPAKYNKHLLIEPIITLRGDEATVVSYYARIDDGESGPFVFSFGRYHDRLVKCEDGKWRFKERLIEREAITREPS